MEKVQVPFLLEGVGSSAAHFSRPELKSYLALEEMWGRSIIKGGHGVELKKNSFPRWCRKGRLCHSQAVGKDLVAGRGLDTGVQGKTHWIPCHLKNGESVPVSLRKSETKTQVRSSVP